MTESLDPFTTLLDLMEGRLDPEREVVERRLSDMRGMYLEEPDGDDDRLVYRVYGIPVPATTDNVLSSTTVIEPGAVGRECFMTKGHFHEIRGRAEIYVGLAGEGRLVMATEDGRVAVEPMRAGTVNYVPGGWAHRSVNVGDEPLVFFAAYPGDAGHDYGTIEERGFPVLVVRGPSGPEVVENPRYRS
ncbi:MAG: glucose-6-phosphate isomerase [Actinomycetota bacterium]|nr:glucose-6-phosphate isomerase [Actinomycetota bacterium]